MNLKSIWRGNVGVKGVVLVALVSLVVGLGISGSLDWLSPSRAVNMMGESGSPDPRSPGQSDPPSDHAIDHSLGQRGGQELLERIGRQRVAGLRLGCRERDTCVHWLLHLRPIRRESTPRWGAITPIWFVQLRVANSGLLQDWRSP